MKFFVFALLVVAVAAEKPRGKRGLIADPILSAPLETSLYSAPLIGGYRSAYSDYFHEAPLSYSAPLSYHAPLSYAAPLSYSAPLPYSAPLSYAAPAISYSAPLSYSAYRAPLIVKSNPIIAHSAPLVHSEFLAPRYASEW